MNASRFRLPLRTPAWCLALPLLLAPLALPAQLVTTVRVAVSATDTTPYQPNACAAETKRPKPAKEAKVAKDSLVVDSLWIRIQDDRDQPAKPRGALVIRGAGRAGTIATIPTDSTQWLVKAAKRDEFPGTVLELQREAGGKFVCAVLLPEPAEAAPEDTSRRAFRVGIGASFDFLNGLSGTDLYYDVTAFMPRIWRGDKRGAFGVDAGLYNGRTTARRDTLTNVTRTFLVARATPDSLTQFRQTITRRNDLTYDRLGVYAAPTWRLAEHLYLVSHAELIKRVAIVTTATLVAEVDTTVIPTPTPRPPGVAPIGTRIPGDTSITRRVTEYESFFGAGPLVQYMHPRAEVEFRLKPMLGFGVVQGETRGFYVVQGRLTDFGNGFKVGAEVRGPLPQPRNPTLLVYLAKDFGFKRLADFVLGGDDDDRD